MLVHTLTPNSLYENICVQDEAHVRLESLQLPVNPSGVNLHQKQLVLLNFSR